ncbi:60S ribosomal protein L6 [Halocaridina rubra]|uniref:Large ribosomal subunit protein eL6 n=1 Tax=Halocaridina rubra TaxID=373956 RepID=A0AAN8ZY94_HALRR
MEESKTKPKAPAEDGKLKIKLPLRGGIVCFGRGKKKFMKRAPEFITKPIGGEKNGGTRTVRVKKLPAYYAPEHNRRKRKISGPKTRQRKLRSSLTPGTVCITLGGLHKGKRVVFLKRLDQGLCLVTGPYKINKCPLRRINQIYLIATATKLDISGIDIPKHIDDRYFRRTKKKVPRSKDGDIFLKKKKERYTPSEQRKKDQLHVDKQIIAAIRKRPDKKYMFGYIGTNWALRSNMYPHLMKF